jgi:hypothetical protein
MKSKPSKIGFYLAGIKTEQFAVFEENYLPKGETGLSSEIDFNIDVEKHQIGVFVNFEFEQENKILLKIKVSCHFKIEEEAWNTFISDCSAKIIFPKGFLAHMAMITVGTSRGVVFAKTEGTLFSKFIIPTINVAEMIQQDVSFDLTN